jgi:hypothetical protein
LSVERRSDEQREGEDQPRAAQTHMVQTYRRDGLHHGFLQMTDTADVTDSSGVECAC